LVLSSNTLYGTTVNGGTSSKGTVFAVNIDGTGFTNLHSFTAVGTDGSQSQAGLILSSNTLYGTTYGGGSTHGIVFAINTDGTGFTNLYTFTGGSDGGNPVAALTLSGNTLYGTANGGGISQNGTVFAVNTDGTGFTNLHSFTGGSGGRKPAGCLTLSGNTLYGTTQFSGSGNGGTIFKVSIFGTDFTNLYSFSASTDGFSSRAGLVLSGSALYGTTSLGGSSNGGTVFAVNTDGTGFIKLHNFTETNGDGGGPYDELILSNNILYGTASQGGTSGHGTVFSLFIQPQLKITAAGPDVVLTWPTNYDGFTLQSTTNLVLPVWITNSQVPVIMNGQSTITNPISGDQQFFRLSQ
jgi:uncharacterized repeat protein (TIGR03803 family)